MTPKPAWTLAATALCAIPAFAFSTVTPPWGSPVDQKSWGTALFEDQNGKLESAYYYLPALQDASGSAVTEGASQAASKEVYLYAFAKVAPGNGYDTYQATLSAYTGVGKQRGFEIACKSV